MKEGRWRGAGRCIWTFLHWEKYRAWEECWVCTRSPRLVVAPGLWWDAFPGWKEVHVWWPHKVCLVKLAY